MSAHTPGPWRASWGRYLPIIAIVDGKDAQIGRAESFGQISDKECEANASLFAAAPELLTVARAIVTSLNDTKFDVFIGSPTELQRLVDVRSAALAAIAKAEGTPRVLSDEDATNQRLADPRRI